MSVLVYICVCVTVCLCVCWDCIIINNISTLHKLYYYLCCCGHIFESLAIFQHHFIAAAIWLLCMCIRYLAILLVIECHVIWFYCSNWLCINSCRELKTWQESPDPPSHWKQCNSNWGCCLDLIPRLLHCVTICIHHRITCIATHRYACSNHPKTLFLC